MLKRPSEMTVEIREKMRVATEMSNFRTFLILMR